MFYKEKRLHLILGNHNRYWEKDKNVRKHLRVLVDDIKLFDDIEKVDEGVNLGDKIFIVHGHLVQFLCDHWLGNKFLLTCKAISRLHPNAHLILPAILPFLSQSIQTRI